MSIIAVLLLASCSNDRTPAAAETDGVEERQRQWSRMADGSHAFSDLSEHVSQAARCWPISGGFDCVFLIGIGDAEAGGSAEVSARRYQHQQPATISEIEIESGGYSCVINRTTSGDLITEYIDRGGGGGTLLKNEIFMSSIAPGSAWSNEFVDEFIRENGIPVQDSYFNCEVILHLLNSGSEATLTTTAVTRGQLLPPDRQSGED